MPNAVLTKASAGTWTAVPKMANRIMVVHVSPIHLKAPQCAPKAQRGVWHRARFKKSLLIIKDINLSLPPSCTPRDDSLIYVQYQLLALGIEGSTSCLLFKSVRSRLVHSTTADL